MSRGQLTANDAVLTQTFRFSTIQKMKEFARVLQQFNTQTLNPAGLHLRHPDKNAWLYLEMEYY